MSLYLPSEDRDAPVVICSELPTNDGASITYAAEQLAAEVIHYHALTPPMVWIEHHPPQTTDGHTETFDLIAFSTLQRSRERGADLSFFVPSDIQFSDGLGADENGNRVLQLALRIGARVCVLHPSLPYHAKLVVLDDEYTVLGNHGWTGESLVLGGDVSVEIRDKRLASEAQRWLLSLAWQSGGRSVT